MLEANYNNTIQHSYRDINKFLNWEPDEDGFYRATSHMLRKFFNTQLINAGMAEEIREHMMGHKFKDRVRDAYYLADPDDLRKTYLRYIDYLNVKSSPVFSIDESYCDTNDSHLNNIKLNYT